MLTDDDHRYLTKYFRSDNLENLCQADIVLALLRDNRRDAVEFLIKKPIQILPAAMPPRIPLPAPVRKEKRIQRITLPEDQNKNSKRYGYLKKLRKGMTKEQALTHIPRRYFWWSVRHQYVELR